VSDIAAIRTGLAGVLAARIQDANGRPDVQAYALETIVPPVVRVLRIEEIQFDIAAAGGGDSIVFTIQAIVGLVDARSSQENLDLMLGRGGAQSVKSAIETKDASGTRSLGGVVDDVWVRSASGYREYDIDGYRFLGAEWLAQVETRTTPP